MCVYENVVVRVLVCRSSRPIAKVATFTLPEK